MYQILPQSQDDVLGIRISEKLTKDDFDCLAPFLKARVRDHAPLRVLLLMEEWRGWASLTALWEDLKLDTELNKHVARIAMVGDEEWERRMTKFIKPFAKGQLRYFDAADLEEAWAWLREPAATHDK